LILVIFLKNGINLTNYYAILEAKTIIDKTFGGKIRVRVCGVCELNGQYLLANHAGINRYGNFWCVPGGGLNFGESIENCLKREFLEETGLTIEVGDFLNVYEFIKAPLHAIELFYKVKITNGELKLGSDPETNNEVLNEVKWMNINDMRKLSDTEIHQFFMRIKTIF
jgi:8-oxo-dGTP diphosphatase